MSENGKSGEDDPPPLSVFGLFYVERRATILALATFMLSIITAGYGLFSIIRGPDIELIEPSFIVLYRHDYDPGRGYVRIVSDLIYSNNGDAGYNTVIKNAGLRFKLDGKTYEFVWLSKAYSEIGNEYCNKQVSASIKSDHTLVEQTKRGKAAPEFPYSERNPDEPLVYNCPSDGSQLAIHLSQSAKAAVLPAGSTAADEVVFEPLQKQCEPGTTGEDCTRIRYSSFLQWDDLLSKIESKKEMTFNFYVTSTDGETEEAKCNIIIYDDDLKEIKDDGWERWRCSLN